MVTIVVALTLFLTKTNVGLQMRAVATNPELGGPVRCLGRPGPHPHVGHLRRPGRLAGALLIPIVPPGQLGLRSMFHILIFATAAALLGGLDSVKGAVVGGLVVGIGLALINGYVTFIGGSISLTVALLVIVAVLVVRPTGLFGARRLERV